MEKNEMPIGRFVAKRPIIDFKKTFFGCLEFVLKNNEMRQKQIEALVKAGYDLAEKRSEMKRRDYERWLESEGVLPKLSGGIETTLEKLISLFMAEFAKGKVKINNQLRFTYSYFQQLYNSQHRKDKNRVCINTIKNHLNKIAIALGSVFQDKYRGTLSLPDRNTNCIVLTFSPNVIQYKESSHTAALSAEEPRLPIAKKSNLNFMAAIKETVDTIGQTSIFDRKSETVGLAESIAAFFR
ncbi:hypothetical protein [Emticicia fontis]